VRSISTSPGGDSNFHRYSATEYASGMTQNPLITTSNLITFASDLQKRHHEQVYRVLPTIFLLMTYLSRLKPAAEFAQRCSAMHDRKDDQYSPFRCDIDGRDHPVPSQSLERG
jgi:hypothetical protein